MARKRWFRDSDLQVIQGQGNRPNSLTHTMAEGMVERKKDKEHHSAGILTVATKTVDLRSNSDLHDKVSKLMIEFSKYKVRRLLHDHQLKLEKTGECQR